MTQNREIVGDKGQRFEIRYRERDELPYKVLGWSETRTGAAGMVRVWKKRPDVTHCWVYDRAPSKPSPTISERARKAVSAVVERVHDATASGYDAAVRPGHWRTP